MKRDQMVLSKIVTVIAVLAIPARLALAAQDQESKQALPANTAATANYNFLIASGFLCDPPASDVCPAVARASDGETIEVNGAGALNLANKSVTGAGAFTEKSAEGYVVTTGVWTATELVSFQPYGIALGALQRDYPQFRASRSFPMGRMPGPMAGPMAGLMAGPVAAGGLAVIRVRLLPDAGSPTDAVLRVTCRERQSAGGRAERWSEADHHRRHGIRRAGERARCFLAAQAHAQFCVEGGGGQPRSMMS